jgi:hypothetical protein
VQRAIFDHVYAGMKLERFGIQELRKKTMSWEMMEGVIIFVEGTQS